MPDKKGNLYLFEAIELRKEYDRHINLLKNLIQADQEKKETYYSNDDEKKEPVSDFVQKEFEEKLEKLQTKRVKLNQAIQVVNFKCQIDYEGEKITIFEALEIRKKLLEDIENISQRVVGSAYKKIIHKEERDIIHESKYSFKDAYVEYQNTLKKLRHLVNQIHIMNHKNTVIFKDE